MSRELSSANGWVFAAVLAAGLCAPVTVRAHCDTLDGPVVTAARAALEGGDVRPALKWVKAENEAEVREAFAQTLAVRRYGEDARRLADTYFFEQLVRIHRAGEGEPYTGLAPAGAADPGIVAADQALASGEVDGLAARLTEELAGQLRARFAEAARLRPQAEASVEAGRAYVAAYVSFIHYVERLHGLAGGNPAGAREPAGHAH
jgi:hypothetical protein